MANKPSTILKLIGKAFVACGWDGSDWQAVNVDSAGDLQVDVKSTALPAGAATAAAQATTAAARTWTKSTVSWTTDDGTGEVELTLAEGEYWVHAQAHGNAVGATAATYTLHADTTTGFTPGASKTEFYTSDADITLPNGVFDANLSPVPISVGVAGKVYLRVVPNAGTTTGSFDLFHAPNQ